VGEFERFVEALSSTVFCQDDVRNEAWVTALEKCNRALAATPRSRTALYLRATALWRLDSLQAALAGFERVIELDPLHQDAHRAAGMIAIRLDQSELAIRYFRALLDLNPGDSDVRIALVNEIVQAGDPETGLAILEEGLTGDSVDVALYKYAGDIAVVAALKRSSQACGEDCAMQPEARALFEKAYAYLQRVMVAQGANADAGMVANMAVVLNKLGRNDELLRLAEQVERDALDVDANFWIAHAEALRQSGDVAGATHSLERAAQKDPTAKVYGRMAAWLIDAGRLDEGIEAGRHAVERAELGTDTFAKMIAVSAYNTRAKADQHDEAIAYYATARAFAEDDESNAMVSFFHGFSLLRQAIALEAPETLATARQTLPLFERARELIQAGAGYDWSASSSAQLLDNVDRYIEIQQAIIKRGR
jgi:tetratricopeptide (TPR) repeat protein